MTREPKTIIWKRDNDEIEVTILPDGAIKIETPGEISAANHASADQLLAALSAAGYEMIYKESAGKKHLQQQNKELHKL